jgi:hypothetical protein
MQMHQVNIFKVNDVVRGLHNIDVVPDSEFTRVTGEYEQTMLEHLVKPISFRSVVMKLVLCREASNFILVVTRSISVRTSSAIKTQPNC